MVKSLPKNPGGLAPMQMVPCASLWDSLVGKKYRMFFFSVWETLYLSPTVGFQFTKKYTECNKIEEWQLSKHIEW